MSRGAGAMQKRIKSKLANGETSVSELCWVLADEARAVEIGGSVGVGIDSGVIRPSFYSGFLRALKGLREKGEVVVSSRVLTSADVAAVYPYKTLRLEVRELRKLVLPHLVRYGDDKGFDREEVEGRILRELEGTQKLLKCQAMWARIESRLWQQGTEPSLRRVVVPLLVCGSGYFGGAGGDARAPGSLSQHLREVKTLLPEDLVDDLRALYRLAFDREDDRRVASKGRFFAFANFGRRQGGVELNEDVLHWLAREIPNVVMALNGFVEAKPTVEGEVDLMSDWVVVRGHTFPLLLRRLVDRRIFQEHEFVRAA
jgi:hypothetical protein